MGFWSGRGALKGAASVVDSMTYFVHEHSIVRRIWGDADMVLLVFAGSAAEFALNRAVDWLFFTGKVPRDPIGRLFTTAGYAQQIVFADVPTASRTLGRSRSARRHADTLGVRSKTCESCRSSNSSK